MQSLPAHLQEYLITNAVNALNQQKMFLFKYVHAELKRRTIKVYSCLNNFWFGLFGYWDSDNYGDRFVYFPSSRYDSFKVHCGYRPISYKYGCYSREWQIEPVN